MEQHPAQPEPGGLDIETLPSIDVPQSDWPSHSLLRRAQLNDLGDGLEWPKATFEQLPLLRAISLIVDDGVLFARLARQFNFDRFVDSATDDNDPAQPSGHATDRQRFYTRVTDNGFHVVGVFSAATIADRRRYFQWLTGAWVEIGLSGFLYVRDDLDTHFSEVTGSQLDETQPGATSTSMTAEDEWTAESVQSQFVGEPMVEQNPRVAPAPPVVAITEADRESMFEPVIEPPIQPPIAPPIVPPIAPLTAATFPHISPPEPQNVADLRPSPPVSAAVPEPVAPEPVALEPVALEPVALEPVVQQTPVLAEPVAAPVTEPAAELPVAPIARPVGVQAPAPAGVPVLVASPDSGAAAAIQRGIAVALATVAHRTDVDLLGAAMIDHVARVAEVFDVKSDYIRHCAAWLHDALERTDLTERELLEAGIQPAIVEIVVLLTRREGVANAEWFAAIAANPDARAVKISAIRDNAAPWRLRKIDASTRVEIERAHAEALAALGSSSDEK